MSSKVSIPTYYQNKHWIESIGTMSLMKRLEDRLLEIERRLPNMSLKEKQELWKVEPYWEVSSLIVSSKDWVFPK